MSADLLQQVETKVADAERLLAECNKLVTTGIAGSTKLKKRVQSELDFISQLKENPSRIRPNHVASTNLTHLSALCRVALEEPAVVGVLAPFPRADQSNLLVDIVAHNGHTWVKVVARNARGLHFNWSGEAGYGERSIVDQAEDYVSTASRNPYMYKSPKIVFVFLAGVPRVIADDLHRRFDIECKGEVVEISSVFDEEETSDEDGDEEEDGSQSSIDDLNEPSGADDHFNGDHLAIGSNAEDTADMPINLDITALIAYVSSLTNGQGAYFKFKEPLLNEQAGWERGRPVLPGLSKLMDDKDRKLLCCQSAYKSFLQIVNTVGGEDEKARTRELLQRVSLVEDHISERTESLQVGGKIKLRSKAIFGSGDYYKAVTLTANRGFVQAACNQGVRLAVILHESRALSEQKQQHAEALGDSGV